MGSKYKQNNGPDPESSDGTKSIVVSILIAAFFVVLAIFYTSFDAGSTGPIVADGNNVSIVDGKQIIDLRAKGGYQPRTTIAKSGISTILRVNTSGTFDCSAAIRIPSMGFSKILPQTGNTDIDLGVPALGVLKGSCGMGMYPFDLDFRN